MKHIIFLLLFIPFIGFSQGGTWPVKYGDSDPSGAPSAAGTRLYINTATNTLFTWEPAPSAQWRKQPKAFDQISGCAAPAYTPTARQSTFAVNSCTPPELYQYTGSAWECLNCVDGLTLTAGAAITLAGTAPDITISNSAPNVVQELSIAGQDLTLSNGGGTVAIPAGDALGTGFTSGGGTGTIPAGTVAGIQEFGVFQIAYSNLNPAIYIDDSEGFLYLYSYNTDAYFSFEGNKAAMGGSQASINATGSSTFVKASSSSGISISNEVNGLGAEYAADYSATIAANPRSIPDVGTVEQIIASENGALGTGFTSGGGTGTLPNATATTEEFGIIQINYFTSGTPALYISDDEGTLALYSPSGLGVFQFEDNNSSMAGEFVTLNGSTSVYVIAGDGLGAQYTSDNSATIITNPASITDVRSVNLLLEKKAFNGNYTATGTATTTFTVTLPTTQPDATYSVSIMPKNALSATGWYISARTTTTFTVTYLTGLTGAVDFDYIVIN